MDNARAADAHRFGRVRKNGYDPTEVDAVVSRLVENLRTYETRNTELEKRLEEADTAADAIRRTFVAAETTKEEIITAARDDAAGITAEASSSADRVLEEARARSADITAEAEARAAETSELARQLEVEVAKRRDDILSEAYANAERIQMDAEADAAERTARAAAEGMAMAEEATATAKRQLMLATLAARYSTLAAARLRSEAAATASQRVASARLEAATLVAEAERDSEGMRQRLVALRAAVAGLEQSARNLAEITATEAAVIDLTEIEAFESARADADEIDEAIDEPLVFEAETPLAESFAVESEDPSEQETIVDESLEDIETDRPLESLNAEPAYAMSAVAATETSHEAPLEAEKPKLTVAEATSEMQLEDEVEDVERVSETRTYYQRSTGTPLSERVRIAKKST